MKRFTFILLAITLVSGLAQAIVPPDLVAYWPFDEGAGTTAFDMSGNGNDGTLTGDPQWVTGQLGTALQFDGTDAYVAAPHIPFNNRSHTIAMWVNSPRTGGDQMVVFGQVDTQSQNLSLHYRVYNNGNVRMGFYSNDLDASGVLEADTWTHITFWYDADGTDRKIYINGQQVAQGSAQPYLGDQGETRIGQWNNSQWFNGMIDDVQVYHRALTDDEIVKIMDGLGDPTLADFPNPEDEATDIWRDTMLTWTPGELADTHDIYLGTVLEDVNDASRMDPRGILISEGQSETRVAPGRLLLDTTYYWRVDEVNAPSSPGINKGVPWSFTTEPLAYPITAITATASSFHGAGIEPEKTIDGSGLDAMDLHGTTSTDMWLTAATDTERWIQYAFDKIYKMHEMWVWNQNQGIESFIGFGAKDVTVEVSTDGENWTTLPDVPEFAKAPGMPSYAHNTTVDFGGQLAKFVKLTINSPWGTLAQSGLSEVRFYYKPVLASYPDPAIGSLTDSIDVTLQWRPGREADQHEVVLSEDEAAVADNSAVLTTTSNNNYTPGPLNYGTTYFWRINDTNNASTPPRYEGNVWSFTAADYLVIDDFEMYEDAEFLEIWAFWLDGYEDDNNGSTVGNGNIGETSIVYQGGQSMPLHFDLISAAIAEATYEFDSPMDWTRGEPNTLSLHVRGDAPSFIDGGDTLTIGASGADLWNAADEGRFVYKNLSGDGSITAKVESLIEVQDWAKAGVMIRESTSAESADAYTVTSAASGVTFQYRLQAFTNAASDSSTRPAEWANYNVRPVWVRVERIGTEFNGYVSFDGIVWEPSVSNPQTVSMVENALIGLCVTSHENTASTAAVFSEITTTGNVTGSWQVVEWGGGDSGHPDNDPAPMYVVVTDSSNNEKVITHSDPSATVNPSWTDWQIPLTDLGSVNLSRIKSVTIGVGERGGSATGAEGTAFIDLLRIGTPLPIVEEPNEPNEPQM